MKVNTFVGFAVMFGGISAERLSNGKVGPNMDAVNRWLGVNYTLLNEEACNSARTQILDMLPHSNNQPIWQETKRQGGAVYWFNVGASNGKYSNDTSSKTLYCGDAGVKVSQDQFKNALTNVYCDGAEQGGGLQVQPVPNWDGKTCKVATDWPGTDRGKFNILCGCKNAPALVPSGATVVNTDPETFGLT